MSEFLEFSLLGLLSGGVMALIALSFVLIYKGTGVVNFAVGEVMMLGAYIYYAGAVSFNLVPWLAFVIALAVIGAFAIGVERAVLRPLSGQPAVSASRSRACSAAPSSSGGVFASCMWCSGAGANTR